MYIWQIKLTAKLTAQQSYTLDKMLESISLIEPLMPSVENRQLVNLASELIEAAAGLNQSVHPVLRQELGTLVRSMNCYYSNLKVSIRIVIDTNVLVGALIWVHYI